MTLKEYRTARELTAKEMATRIGTSAAYVYQLESGFRKPSLSLKKVITALTRHQVKIQDW